MSGETWVKSFSFPNGTSLDGGATLKIWANGASGATNAAGNLIWTGDSSWGCSRDVLNILRNDSKEVGSKQIEHQFREKMTITESYRKPVY